MTLFTHQRQTPYYRFQLLAPRLSPLQWEQKRSWLAINVVWCLLKSGLSQGEVCIDTLKIWACLSVLCHQLWLSVSFARSGIMEIFSSLLFPNRCWLEGWEQPWLWWEEGSVLGIWNILWCCILNPRLKNRKSIWPPSWKVYHAPELVGTWRLFLWTLGKDFSHSPTLVICSANERLSGTVS